MIRLPELTAMGSAGTAGMIQVVAPETFFDQTLWGTFVTFGEVATIVSLMIGAGALVVSILRYRQAQKDKR